MQKLKRRKIWLLIWASLLLLSITLGAFNWTQARKIVDEMEETISQQASTLSSQANIPALEKQQNVQLRILELNKQLFKNGMNRLILIFLMVAFGMLTIVAYRRLKKAEKEGDPQALIQEIGRKP